VNQLWEPLATGVYRCRLAFLDVTVGLVLGRDGMLLIDSGSTLDEARAIDADVRTFDARGVTQLVLTHDHFDHVLGASAFTDSADVVAYAMPRVAETLTHRADELRRQAIEYGAAAADIDAALAAVRLPTPVAGRLSIDLGDRSVEVEHPGPGHTDHDLIVTVPPLRDGDSTVVFCGDLIEESGDPSIEPESDVTRWPATLNRVLEVGGPQARYVPGHGAVVDAEYVTRQREWLLRRQ
jgi:glyoxylase-like metal-dependent hydrolase (beta-lactamase superfamily II)